jgi:hypothetical protein
MVNFRRLFLSKRYWTLSQPLNLEAASILDPSNGAPFWLRSPIQGQPSIQGATVGYGAGFFLGGGFFRRCSSASCSSTFFRNAFISSLNACNSVSCFTIGGA